MRLPAALDPTARRQARLLVRLLVGLTAISLLAAIIVNIISPLDPWWQNTRFFLTTGICGSLFTAYLLNRTGRYTVAASLTVSAISIGIFAGALASNALASNSLLLYLVLPVLLSSVLLSVRATFILSLADIVGMILLPSFVTLESSLSIVMPLTFFAVTAAGILLVTHHRNLLEQDRQAQQNAMMQSLPVGITIQSAQGKIVYANDKAAELIGYPSAQAVLETPQSDILSRFQLFDEAGQALPLERLPGRLAIHGSTAPAQILRFRILATGEERWSLVKAIPLDAPSDEDRVTISVFEDITALKRAENGQRFLIDAGTILTASLSYEATLSSLARLAVSYLADWCVVDMLEPDGAFHRLAAAAADPAKEGVVQRLQQRYPKLEASSMHTLANAFRMNRSWIDPDVSPERLAAEARDAEHLQIELELGFKSEMVIPLMARERLLGTITLVSASRSYSHEDLVFAEDLARRAAIHIDNARLYRDAQDQRRWFQVTLSSIGDAVIATDVQGHITFMNAMAEKLTGYPTAEGLGMDLERVFRIVNESTQADAENPVTRVLREQTIVGLANHTLLIAKDGTHRPIDDSGAPIYDDSGALIGVILVFRDITERRQIEVIREHTLRRTLDSFHVSRRIGLARTPDDVLRALLSSHYLAPMSQAALLTFAEGWDDQRPNAYDVLAILQPDRPLPGFARNQRFDSSPYNDLISLQEPVFIQNCASDSRLNEPTRQLLSESNICSIGLVPLFAAGERFGMLALYCPVADHWSDENIRHVRIFVEQVAVAVSHMRLLIAEANARREAEKANQIKLQFLAMISHELRTPLTPIKGFVTTLLNADVTWDAENQRHFLTIINDEVDKLTDLIDQLLDLSRLVAGRLRVQRKPQQIQAILNIAMTQLRFLTARHELRIEIPPDLPTVLADPQRIAQVIGNLVGNAAKYAPPQTPITISASSTDNEVQVDVRDEGPGIPIQDREGVFEAFRQVENTAQQRNGAGLGLAICKGLIEAHEGRIWIADGPLPGTTVSFALPVG